MISKVFHVLLACLVAFPFGQGGLCCCLFQAPAAREVAHAATPSCCEGKGAPSASASDQNSDGESCTCPTRDTFLHESPASNDLAFSFAADFLAPAPFAVRDAPFLTLATSRLPRVALRPPKVPLHRTLCIALC